MASLGGAADTDADETPERAAVSGPCSEANLPGLPDTMWEQIGLRLPARDAACLAACNRSLWVAVAPAARRRALDHAADRWADEVLSVTRETRPAAPGRLFGAPWSTQIAQWLVGLVTRDTQRSLQQEMKRRLRDAEESTRRQAHAGLDELAGGEARW